MPRSRRPGRPATVDRAAIAEVVLELGPDRATMRSVADALGMSLPGLYHHVRGQPDLRRLAAEHILAESTPPDHGGEHWAHYLRRCAWFIRQMCDQHESLLGHLLDGVVDDDTRLAWISDSIEVLVAQGFDPKQAQTAWATITMLAVGNAVDVQRERRAVTDGGGWSVRTNAFVSARQADDVMGLRAVLSADVDPFSDESFERQLDVAILGVTQLYGVLAEPIT